MNKPAWVAAIFGSCVVASGLVRYFSSPDGEKGLWFGLIMGCTAMIAGGCFANGKTKTGRVMIWFCLLVVGGWFVFEALIKKGWAASELRMLVVIAVTFSTTVFFAFHSIQSATKLATGDEKAD